MAQEKRSLVVIVAKLIGKLAALVMSPFSDKRRKRTVASALGNALTILNEIVDSDEEKSEEAICGIVRGYANAGGKLSALVALFDMLGTRGLQLKPEFHLEPIGDNKEAFKVYRLGFQIAPVNELGRVAVEEAIAIARERAERRRARRNQES